MQLSRPLTRNTLCYVFNAVWHAVIVVIKVVMQSDGKQQWYHCHNTSGACVTTKLSAVTTQVAPHFTTMHDHDHC